MARRDDAKDAALAASRTLNGDPQKVTDAAWPSAVSSIPPICCR